MLTSKRTVYNRPRFACGRTGGFTMVEILVALAILSTSMLAVFGVLRMCVMANSGSQRLTEAVLLAESLMAETTLDTITTYQTVNGGKGLFTWQIQTAPTGMDNLAAVCVKVQWLQQQKPQEYQLRSLTHIPALMEGK